MVVHTSDVLVIGSGLSGLYFAHKLSNNSNLSISVISKTELIETNTKHAQGGIAAVIDDDDSFASHIQDTLVAGAGLCRKNIVKEVVEKGPDIITKLQELGVEFDKSANNIALGKEGAHSNRRIAHVADHTGLAIQKALVDTIRNSSKVDIFEQHIAIDLVTINGKIAGAYVLNKKTQEVNQFQSRLTVLATGGVGKVFLYTSNPDIASGDGVAMAYRAGACVANMEFIQFHPTLYYNTEFRNFLISEAVRGEGAILKNLDDYRFMPDVHELAELAPRDVVSREIDLQLKRHGDDYIHLDISHKDPQFIRERFPTIYETTLKHGHDMTKRPIPVVPAAHYTIGGIRAKLNGETNITGLLAIGEVAYTGLHGANRLASNSLLEAAVMASKAADHAKNIISELNAYEFKEWQPGDAVDSDEAVIVSHNWDELRRLMWNYVGIVRSTKRLLRAEKRIELLKQEINQYYWNFKVSPDIIELRNLVQVAELIVTSALFRKESRGAHYTLDYPEISSEIRDTLIHKHLGVHPSDKIIS